MKTQKITNYILMAIALVFLFYFVKNFLPTKPPPNTTQNKNIQEKVLYTYQFIVEDGGFYKETPFVIRKGRFLEKPIVIKGMAKVFYIIPEVEKNYLLWVKMAKTVKDLEHTVPKSMTVNKFNSVVGFYRCFDFILPPGSPDESLSFNLYVKDET